MASYKSVRKLLLKPVILYIPVKISPTSKTCDKSDFEMKIEIRKPKMEDIEKEGIISWPIWEKEISRFDRHYDETEECYLLEGKAVVETDDGEKVQFGKGDFVTFPKGLSCVWEIKEPVKKHYNFR